MPVQERICFDEPDSSASSGFEAGKKSVSTRKR
jgi:hypothetical protein